MTTFLLQLLILYIPVTTVNAALILRKRLQHNTTDFLMPKVYLSTLACLVLAMGWHFAPAQETLVSGKILKTQTECDLLCLTNKRSVLISKNGRVETVIGQIPKNDYLKLSNGDAISVTQRTDITGLFKLESRVNTLQ